MTKMEYLALDPNLREQVREMLTVDEQYALDECLDEGCEGREQPDELED